MTRTRSKILRDTQGWAESSFGTYGGYPIQAGTSTCVDLPGPGDGQYFRVSSYNLEGARLNKPRANWYDYGYVNYLCDNADDASQRAHLPTPSVTDGEYAVALRYRTNPSRPLVDLPLTGLETKFIPEALREEGDRLVKDTPLLKLLKSGHTANLEIAFNLAPLISDLLKMGDFTSRLQRKMKDLKALSDGTYRKTLVLDEVSASQVLPGRYFHTQGVLITGRLAQVTRHKVKGHIRWIGGTFAPTIESQEYYARQILQGLTVDFATAWNLIPWSWFDDWFSNIGDYLEGHRNIVDGDVSLLNIMHEIETVSTGHYDPLPPGVTVSPLKARFVTKSRDIVPESVTFRMPLLDAGQTGLLASIGVLDRLGRRTP